MSERFLMSSSSQRRADTGACRRLGMDRAVLAADGRAALGLHGAEVRLAEGFSEPKPLQCGIW